MKKHKKLIITISILAVIVIVAFIATLPLYTTNSNLDKYDGVKKEAALRALDHQYDYPPNSAPRFLPPQIEEVMPNTTRPCSSDPTSVYYYAVTIKRVGLFGTAYGTSTYLICNMG